MICIEVLFHSLSKYSLRALKVESPSRASWNSSSRTETHLGKSRHWYKGMESEQANQYQPFVWRGIWVKFQHTDVTFE